MACWLIDLDGTLVDLCADPIQLEALRAGSLAVARAAGLRPRTGSIFGLHRQVLRERGRDAAATRRLRAVADVCERSWARRRARLRPGLGALALLRREGHALALVTSNGRACVEALDRRFGLAAVFDAIVTRDDVERLKPDPDPLLRALERLGLAAGALAGADVRVVGDSEADRDAAAALAATTGAAVCFTGIRRGGAGRRDLPDARFEDVGELVASLGAPEPPAREVATP